MALQNNVCCFIVCVAYRLDGSCVQIGGRELTPQSRDGAPCIVREERGVVWVQREREGEREREREERWRDGEWERKE